MMDRRQIARCLAASAAVVASPFAARAQRATQRPIVGFVSAVGRNDAHVAALATGLREAGFEPDRQLDLVERYAEGDLERLKHQIDELVRIGASVFVTAGDNAMRLIQERDPKAPVVVAVLGNYGNVVIGGSINRPPGNVTGFSNLSAELAAKRLDLLREMVSDLKHCALLVNPAVANAKGQPEAYRNAAASLGIKLAEINVGPGNDLTAALYVAKAAGARGLVVYRNFLFETRRADIAAAVTASALPAIFEERFFVEMGGLVSYSTNLTDLFHRSAAYVAKILKGAKPSDLPIQLPAKFEVVVNQRAAQALGLTISPSVLIRADEVIE